LKVLAPEEMNLRSRYCTVTYCIHKVVRQEVYFGEGDDHFFSQGYTSDSLLNVGVVNLG
jgi:hypothetical protein